MRASRGRLSVVTAASLALAGCFELVVPPGAQITCSVDDPTCPAGLQCCEGRVCQQQCACAGGAEPCGLNGAVDCAGLRQCADHCWAACPTCAERCANPALRTCQADEFAEVWFCAAADVCVVKHGPVGTTPTAACHRPPPQCSDESARVCACLQAPFSISPPCAPFEHCTDYSQPCVACRQELPTGVDGGLTDRQGVGVDVGAADGMSPPADAGASFPDSSVVGIDASAGVPDASSDDAAAVETPMRLGDDGPACYTVPDGGTLCCELVDNSALFSDATGSYDCLEGSVLATECTAFDDGCAAAASLCNAARPPAPCNGTSWECPAGSVVLSRCGGLCTN
jgi:hypothetical protein